MNCPNCNGTQIRTPETRHTDKGSITRRRVCADCNYHWSSVEIIIPETFCYWRAKHWHVYLNVLQLIRKSLLDILLTS